MAVPVRALTLYVPTLVRARRLRPVDGSSGVGRGVSSFIEAEARLAVSPMLVGGVEEDDCTAEQSTVMPLWIDSEEGARVISGRDAVSSCSEIAKNIAVGSSVA